MKFDRNGDSDIDITLQNQKVAELYIRKQSTYTENEIVPYVKLEDLRPDMIRKTRQLAVNFRPNHPWETLNDFDLLKSAQLYQENSRTGKSGFTMAAVLLFGKDDVISSVLPHYKTDAILRKENIDRYDDRDDIRTNLIESYERLMAFIAKHLPDKFYLEKDQRISLRDKIFREVVSNILIHREFSSAFPAKLIIEECRVYTENNNKPHGHGLIDPTNFTPYPKNPIIARFFKEIGRADELSSGVRNLYKFCKAYNGADPELIEEDIFKIVISLSQAAPQADEQDKKIDRILEYCKEPRTRAEIQEYINISDREYFRNRYLKPLIGKELLKPTHPENLNNPKQKYYTVKTRRTQDDD